MKKWVPWFCLVATAGANVAFANNGVDAYRQGHYDKAVTELIAEAKHDPIVDYYMGRMRLYGYGQLKNNIAAIRYFTEAAEKGLLPAQRIMGSYALLKEKNPEQALVWFKKAAEANDVPAQLYCAAAYLFGVGTKKNSEAARRYFIAAAKNGNALGQYALADSFIESRQSENKKLGLIWLNKAVLQNSPEAQLKLGMLYANGTMVTRDVNKAKELIGLSIAQGYVPALYQMGDLCRKEGDIQQAKDWYTKAINAHYKPAEKALAELYLQPKGSLYDPHQGFSLMLKAAQNGSSDAQLALSLLYKTGQGVEASPELAAEWLKKSTDSAKETSANAQVNAAEWLTHGKQKTLAASGYQLHGILKDWQNPATLKENNYNQFPRMDVVTRAELYRPQFVLTNPNEIAISEYYDGLASLLGDPEHNHLQFPRYPIDKQLPLTEVPGPSQVPQVSVTEKGIEATHPSQKLSSNNKPMTDETLANYLLERAILGDSSSQFTLAQMYQDGVGMKKNAQEAIKYYQLSTEQQELRSEYNLAIMYLEGRDVAADYEQGMALLRDAAFKGNDYAQYALALIYEQGYRNAAGEVIIKPDASQAIDMYNLAAANDYGLAQYRLAEILVREKQVDMSVAAREKRNQQIKQLYQGALTAGVQQAALPLAFFNAMEKDKAKQAEAFAVANKEAETGRAGAALLLGLLYDRGIGVAANHDEALHWYQQPPVNPVSAFILGTYISQGAGISKDLTKGKALLQQAADAGFSYANLNLGVVKQQTGESFLPELDKAYAMGNGTAGLLLADYYLSLANDDQKMQQARDIYQSLAEKGNKDGQLKLGFMFDRGLGGAVDKMSAQKWYTLSAEQGQVVAEYLLGQLYQLGLVDSQPDYAEAKKWYTAAQSHYAPAAVALGFLYDTVDDDYQAAQNSYQLAANAQDPIGQFDLGLIYEQGKGRPVDYEKAKALYLSAAEKGVSSAMVQLAGILFNGLAGDRDESAALEWYKKAATLGNRDALYQLGLLSETGVSMKLDYSEAVRYYQNAADKGNAKAMLALARMYQHGSGIPKDNQQAEKWYQELAVLGNAYAQYQLATFYYEGVDGARMSEKGKQLLQQAQANGSTQASRTLQWLAALSQERTSFIEPAVVNQMPALQGQPADLMYMDALNEWNRGDERTSMMILKNIKTQFPDYLPAKRAYEQLKQQLHPAIKG